MPGPVQLAEQEEEDAPKKKKKFMRSGKCLNCKEKGHLKMECPKLTEERRKELQVECLSTIHKNLIPCMVDE